MICWFYVAKASAIPLRNFVAVARVDGYLLRDPWGVVARLDQVLGVINTWTASFSRSVVGVRKVEDKAALLNNSFQQLYHVARSHYVCQALLALAEGFLDVLLRYNTLRRHGAPVSLELYKRFQQNILR